MPRLAAFPKAYMQALCKDGTMSLHEWIDMASSLEIDGLEWYAGFLEMEDQSRWPEFRESVESLGMTIPMLCCSPDFTHPEHEFREAEIEKQRHWIDMSAALGACYCRVLSGQRRPEVSLEDGLRFATQSIEACLPYAEEKKVILILENHYKDDFWTYPEFAQKKEVFAELVGNLYHPNFGVNYDPSNAFLAGDDPIELLDMILDRVVTMHASDRYLLEGTLEDLKNDEVLGQVGYAKRLKHGEIGQGLNDYDAIFSRLSGRGFNGWISIEDGVDGFDQLQRSVAFLKKKIAEYWPSA